MQDPACPFLQGPLILTHALQHIDGSLPKSGDIYKWRCKPNVDAPQSRRSTPTPLALNYRGRERSTSLPYTLSLDKTC